MPAMDIDFGTTALERQCTPPVKIASSVSLAVRRGLIEETIPIPKLNHDVLHEKAKKRKKNKKKGMPPAAPAAHVIKGFQTPVTSAGEESDVSVRSTSLSETTKWRDFSSVTSSPSIRPATPGTGGLSILKARLDRLALEYEDGRPNLTKHMSNESNPYDSTASTRSCGSDSDRTELETYDVSLGQDFVSPDAGARNPSGLATIAEAGVTLKSVNRKMCADDFTTLRCLGKGAFGTVHLVKQHTTGRLYAQKQFRKASLTVHKRLVEQTRTERTILESVNRHPFVVKLYYAFQDHEKLYLILEYAQGGELFHHLEMERMFPADVAAFYMAEMVLALEHLHQNVRVIYRDLKPENCLLDAEGHLLLTDFGLSKVSLEDDEPANSILGTIDYMAPEVVRGDAYDFAVDWWSLGAIGFDFMTGAPPFRGNNHAKIQQNILKQKLQMPGSLGPDAKDLLTRLMRKEPNKRLGSNGSKDIKIIKGHRFFRKIDWSKLERRELEPPIQPVVTDPELAENFSSDFTDLPLSPVLRRQSKVLDSSVQPSQLIDDNNPFGGFSFVASTSLLESDGWLLEE